MGLWKQCSEDGFHISVIKALKYDDHSEKLEELFVELLKEVENSRRLKKL